MPNHFHVIVEIKVVATLVVAQHAQDAQDTEARASKQGQPQGIAPTLETIIGGFKSVTTNEYIRGVKQNQWPAFEGKLWQRNYYEHIIRNARSHEQIAHYITTNPERWEQDRFYA